MLNEYLHVCTSVPRSKVIKLFVLHNHSTMTKQICCVSHRLETHNCS